MKLKSLEGNNLAKKSIKFNLVESFEPSIFFKEGDSLSRFGIG